MDPDMGVLDFLSTFLDAQFIGTGILIVKALYGKSSISVCSKVSDPNYKQLLYAIQIWCQPPRGGGGVSWFHIFFWQGGKGGKLI